MPISFSSSCPMSASTSKVIWEAQKRTKISILRQDRDLSFLLICPYWNEWESKTTNAYADWKLKSKGPCTHKTSYTVPSILDNMSYSSRCIIRLKNSGTLLWSEQDLTCSVSKISRRCSRPRLFRNWLMFMSSPTTTVRDTAVCFSQKDANAYWTMYQTSIAKCNF